MPNIIMVWGYNEYKVTTIFMLLWYLTLGLALNIDKDKFSIVC